MTRLLAAAVIGLTLLSPTLRTFADASAAAADTAPAKKAKIAVIKLSDTLIERPKSFELSLSSLNGNDKAVALSTLIVTLNKAAKDPAVAGVLLDMSAFTLTLNQAQEIGHLITTVRHAGKRVAAYSADYDTDTYTLASYADTILMPENGNILIPGVSLQMIFFKGTLDKLDLQPDFVQIGKFKGAEEPFMRTTASPEYREQITHLVDGMYDEVIATIAANRPNMEEATVKTAVNEGLLTGTAALKLGLIDHTMGRGGVDAWLDSQFPAGATQDDTYGQPRKKSIDMDSPFAIFSLLGEKPKVRSHEPEVAVIYAVGEIVPDFVNGEDSSSMVTPAGIRGAVDKALADDQVKAIVLRVDSPGGSASASDEIWSILHEADKKKPVTVSMGRVAASGGYYISCAGRTITADPATITGSIGVVAGKIVIKGLLDKIGVNIETVSLGDHAGMLSAMQTFTDEERAFLQKSMEETYGVFTGRVMGARGSKIPKLENVAQGRLFTGEQAKTAGLVDTVGTLDDAIAAAAKSVGIGANYQMLVLPEAKDIGDILRDSLMNGASLPPLSAVKADPFAGLLEALPTNIQTEARDALLIVKTLEHERILMTLPIGLSEAH
jgi:protease-4